MTETIMDETLFWELAEPLLAAGQAEEGTMMGFRCLRAAGAFFATLERSSGDLVVKTASSRVDELIASGVGLPFAPAGRRFKEWVQIPGRDAELWERLLHEAREFVAGGA